MQEILSFGMCTWICGKENDEGYLEMRKDKIRILHIAQAAGGVDRYIRMLLKYLDKEKFENILVCSQDFREEDYKNLVDFFEQVKMDRAIGSNDLKAIGEVRRLIKRYNPDIVYAHRHSRKINMILIIHALNNRIASFTAAYVSSIRHSIYRKQKTH